MNKAGIVEVVQGVLGGTKVQAEQVVDTVFDTIVKTLKKGEEVSIAGIGIFSVKQRFNIIIYYPIREAAWLLKLHMASLPSSRQIVNHRPKDSYTNMSDL